MFSRSSAEVVVIIIVNSKCVKCYYKAKRIAPVLLTSATSSQRCCFEVIRGRSSCHRVQRKRRPRLNEMLGRHWIGWIRGGERVLKVTVQLIVKVSRSRP